MLRKALDAQADVIVFIDHDVSWAPGDLLKLDLWLVPDLDITHHGSDGSIYPGNYHGFLMRQPGGSEAQNGA